MKRQPYAVFDIDGTIFRSSLLLEITYRAIANGVLSKSLSTELARYRDPWLNRKHDETYQRYILKIVNVFYGNIKNVRVSDLQDIAKLTIDELHGRVYVYTRELIKQLKNKGYFLIAISGSPLGVVEEFAKHYGFDVVKATSIGVKNGFYTNNVQAADSNKHLVLSKIIKKYNLSSLDSIAIGDSGGDIGMLKVAKKAIAFNPDKLLFKVAKNNGWKIVIERKNLIYELENADGQYVLVKTNV